MSDSTPQVVDIDIHDEMDETLNTHNDGEQSEVGSQDQDLHDSSRNMQHVNRRAAQTSSNSAHIQIPADAFQDMLNTINDLRTRVSQLQSQQQSQQQVVVAPVATALTSPAIATPTFSAATISVPQSSVMRPAPNKPEKFNGVSDLKSGGNVTAREFLNQLFLYFENVKPTSQEMASLAASYMVGEAGSWATARIKQLQANGKTDSWVEFEKEFRELYCPISNEQVARSQLTLLRQGKTSVSEYYQKFQRLCLEIPKMDGATSLDMFVKGLKPKLHEEVYLRQPQSLDEAQRLATRLEGMYQIIGAAASSSLHVMEEEEAPRTAATTRWEQQLSQLVNTVQQHQQQLAVMNQQQFGNNNNVGDKNKRNVVVCEGCKRKGHTKDKCWKLHPELMPDWVKLRNASRPKK